MNKKLLQLVTAVIMIAFTVFSLSSCVKDTCTSTEEFVEWQPVFKSSEELRTDIAVLEPRILSRPGNINYFNGFMFINEILEGVHIIDNRLPENPINIAFIDIPGSRDLAIRNGVLYVDSYLDLLAIDITIPTEAKLVHREKDVFQSYLSQNSEFEYLVEYVETDVKRTVNCTSQGWGRNFFFRDDFILMNSSADPRLVFSSIDFNSAAEVAGISPGGVGIGGSMARFTITKGHMYALDQFQIQVFDLESNIPMPVNKVSVSSGTIETLFPAGEHLFMGTSVGMQIFDVSNPAAPVFLSNFEHVESCDPVFVSGDVAYVTLREGNFCANAVNQLEVIDIKDIENPTLIHSYDMHHPHGLSVVNNTMFLCEGDNGLKVFDVTDKNKIASNQLSQIGNLNAFDVIVLPPGNLVMVIGPDGFFQFDASDPNDLKELSHIPIVKQ